MRALEPKLRLWHTWHWVTDDNKAADLIGQFCCKMLARYCGEPLCIALWVKWAILYRIHHSTGSQWSYSSKAEDEEDIRKRCCATSLCEPFLNSQDMKTLLQKQWKLAIVFFYRWTYLPEGRYVFEPWLGEWSNNMRARILSDSENLNLIREWEG